MLSGNRKFQVFSLFFVWLVFSIFFVSNALAQGKIKLGKLSVLTSLKYRVEHTDNVFKAYKNEESDFLHKIIPKISLNFKGSRPENTASVGISADLVAYDDFSDNNYQKYSPFMTLSYKMPSGFYLKASDTYTKTSDPYGSISDFNVGQRTKRWNNVLRTTWGYDVTSKYSVEVLYAYSLFRYYNAADKWQEYDRHRYGGVLLYHLTPKLSLLAQYRRTEQAYGSQNDNLFDPDRGLQWSSDTSQDFTTNDYFLGARFKPGGKLSGEMKVGYTDKSFDNEYDLEGKRYKDASDWGVEGSLTFNATARTTLVLDLLREYRNAPDVQEVSQYIATSTWIRLMQKLPRDFLFTGGLRWQNWDYQNESASLGDKELDIYTARAELQWKIREWLLSGLEYKYVLKEANKKKFETDEYTENLISWYIEATY